MRSVFAVMTIATMVFLSLGAFPRPHSRGAVAPPSPRERLAATSLGGFEARPAPRVPPRMTRVPPPRRAVPATSSPPCTASWYGEQHRGRPMANGEPFDPDAATVASWTHPFGTVLAVTSTETGVTVEVTVTDRGPAKRLRRCLDLSRSAFERLGVPLGAGLAEVTFSEVG